MSTATIRPGNETHESPKKKKAIAVDAEPSIAELKKRQKAELKQGLTEAVLISRGEMDGIPLSELWDE